MLANTNSITFNMDEGRGLALVLLRVELFYWGFMEKLA